MRFGWLITFVIGVALAATPIIRAEEAHAKPAEKVEHASGGHDEHGSAHEGNAMLDLGLWTVVVFVILLLILRKFAWGPMLAGLQQRESNIRGALEEAEKARDEAQSIRLSLQKEMNDANLKVKAIIEDGKKSAQTVADDMVAKAKADIATERDRMNREIQMTTDQAMQAIWSRTAELATQISSKALGRSVDNDGHKRLIDDALKELKQAGANGHA